MVPLISEINGPVHISNDEDAACGTNSVGVVNFQSKEIKTKENSK